MRNKKILLSLAVTLLLANSANANQSNENTVLDTVDVTTYTYSENSAAYTVQSMNTASKMDLDVLDTPQSISVITSEQMRDFSLTDINDTVESISGIVVERVEPDRTVFNSRGFQVKNFLVDGVSFPLSTNYKYGDEDMALYDRVEITKGATGLTSAHGNPSATVNLVRKKPTKDFQASLKASAGSWDYRRFEVDVSGPLTQSKNTRARFIATKTDGKSYMDRYEEDEYLVAALIEHDISDTMLFRAGFSKSADRNDGNPWGGVPVIYRDGKATDYDISTNIAAKWGNRNIKSKDAYIELQKYFANDWKLRTTYTYKNLKDDALMSSVWGMPNRDESGVFIDWMQDFKQDATTHVLDVTYDGTYELFNQEHSAVASLNLAKRKVTGGNAIDRNSLSAPVNLKTWDGNLGKPTYTEFNDTDYEEKLVSLMLATNYNFTDDFSALAGVKFTNWKSEGEDLSRSRNSEDKGVITPYLGLVYKFNDTKSLYASYATSFKPQDEVDKNKDMIDPAEGTNYEIGFKSRDFDGKLNSSIAFFETRFDNKAVYEGNLPDGTSYSREEDGVKSRGYELEIAGSLTDEFDLSFGYTKYTLKDADKKQIDTFMARKMLKTMLTYKPSFIPGLKLGTAVKYKGDISIDTNYGEVRQGGITLVDLMANYRINKNLKVSFNVNNVTDKKHYGSLFKSYVTYAEPRKVGVSLEYKF